MNERLKMKLAGMDGNIFAILGKASQLLRRNGPSDQAKEMSNRVFESHSYESVLHIISEYVEMELSTPLVKNTGARKRQNHNKDHR